MKSALLCITLAFTVIFAYQNDTTIVIDTSNDDEYLAQFLEDPEKLFEERQEELSNRMVDPEPKSRLGELLALTYSIAYNQQDGDFLQNRTDRELLVHYVNKEYKKALKLIAESTLGEMFLATLLEEIYTPLIEEFSDEEEQIEANKTLQRAINYLERRKYILSFYITLQELQQFFPRDRALKVVKTYVEAAFEDVAISDSLSNHPDSLFLRIVDMDSYHFMCDSTAAAYAYSLSPSKESVQLLYVKKCLTSTDRETWEKIVDVLALPLEDPASLLLRADALISLHRYAEALVPLDTLLIHKRRYQYKIPGYKQRIKVYKVLNQIEPALKDLEVLDTMVTKPVVSYKFGMDPIHVANMRGNLYSHFGEYIKANESYRKAIELIKNNSQFPNSNILGLKLVIAWNYLYLKNYELSRNEISEYLPEVASMKENHIQSAAVAAYSYLFQGDYASALKEFDSWREAYKSSSYYSAGDELNMLQRNIVTLKEKGLESPLLEDLTAYFKK